jgi:hypothetical protein
MIENMAFEVWKCGRCLSMVHDIVNCVNEIRCRNCYKYGHIRRNCLSRNSMVWVPKKTQVQADKDPVELNRARIDFPLYSSGVVSPPRVADTSAAASPVLPVSSLFYRQ